MSFDSGKPMNLNALFKNLFLIISGTLLLAFGTVAFLIPFELVTGGISGIAIIISAVFGDAFLPIDSVIAALTWLSFFCGLIFLGKSFALKTLLSAVFYPLFISIFMETELAEISGAALNFGGATALASILGGAFVGLGCAMSFIGGGSTGGVDVLALVLCKGNPHLKISKIMLAIDSLVIMLGALAISDPKKTALGIFSALTAAFTIETALHRKRH